MVVEWELPFIGDLPEIQQALTTQQIVPRKGARFPNNLTIAKTSTETMKKRVCANPAYAEMRQKLDELEVTDK